MKIIIPFKALKKIYSAPDDHEVMGILHSNDNLYYDRVLISHVEENKSANDACKINDIVVGTVSFHTHPKICYEIFKVNIGWPSLDDVISFINEEKMKIIIVASMEGSYILVKKNKIPSVMIKKIKEHYKYSINKKNTKVEEYVERTNKICNNCILVLFFSKETIEKNINDKINIDVHN